MIFRWQITKILRENFSNVHCTKNCATNCTGNCAYKLDDVDAIKFILKNIADVSPIEAIRMKSTIVDYIEQCSRTNNILIIVSVILSVILFSLTIGIVIKNRMKTDSNVVCK